MQRPAMLPPCAATALPEVARLAPGLVVAAVDSRPEMASTSTLSALRITWLFTLLSIDFFCSSAGTAAMRAGPRGKAGGCRVGRLRREQAEWDACSPVAQLRCKRPTACANQPASYPSQRERQAVVITARPNPTDLLAEGRAG